MGVVAFNTISGKKDDYFTRGRAPGRDFFRLEALLRQPAAVRNGS